MGLRRRRPRLKPSLLGALLLACTACFGLSEQEEQKLAFFREISLGSYEQGDYVRSLHQSTKALELDADDEEMRLVRAYSLLKLSRGGDIPMLDESLAIFEDLADDGAGDDDFRVWLGLGSAHMARAFVTDRELADLQRQLSSEFLSESSRVRETLRRDRIEQQRLAHMQAAEKALREVLSRELHRDNVYALVDLTVVLNVLGGHDAESVELAERAIAVMDEHNALTRSTLDKNTRLTPAARITLQQRIAANEAKQGLLLDLIATVLFNNADYDGFLRQVDRMEARGLIGEAQLYNRALVHEQLGDYDAAEQDLDSFLRRRVLRLDYDEDEMAPEVLERLEQLRARHGSG